MKQVLDDYNWRDGVLQIISERMEKLEQIICIKEKSLQKPREGRIRVLKRNNSFQYFLRTSAKDTNGKYIPSDKRQIAVRIAQRDYDEKIVEVARRELRIAADYVEMLKQGSVADVFESLNTGKKSLVIPVFIPDDQYVDSWQKVEYEPMPVQDDIDFCTNSGIRVRSKSELIIANMLEQKGVPYRYEFPISLKRIGQIRPDFTCLNVRTRKEYIWEHFGMMDNIAYANKNIAKIEVYEQSGYFQGKNMIMTFETSQHALSSNIIKAMIEQYLV